MLVFLPSTRTVAERLREGSGTPAPQVGYAATAGLRRAHGLGPAETEEAEYTALAYAGAAALVAAEEPVRLVLAAEVAEDRLTGGPRPDLGEVVVSGLGWGDVVALFLDDRDSRAAVARARAAVAGQALVDAVETEPVRALLEEVDLLWYDPAELDHLPLG
ncbi:MAG: DUF6912 family protein [Actinomycetes bacterium]